MSTITPGWKHLAIVSEGSPVLIGGQDAWRHEWRSIAVPPITVRHPSYPAQRHQMFVYELEVHPPLRFAAGEYSNGVWGFYVPAAA
jgi:hypothetical protein